ncbi:hypothetical protein VP01_2495g4 [Puccinia sorghi]|uniref:Uncharacterized protein n=1 Tax=Puccinia sorghi TaxID=27349 RepID=A0A0L6V5M9_9BASI|nr:hypothetical protein VP01_2495g4 [Puccinia sorghi]
MHRGKIFNYVSKPFSIWETKDCIQYLILGVTLFQFDLRENKWIGVFFFQGFYSCKSQKLDRSLMNLFMKLLVVILILQKLCTNMSIILQDERGICMRNLKTHCLLLYLKIVIPALWEAVLDDIHLLPWLFAACDLFLDSLSSSLTRLTQALIETWNSLCNRCTKTMMDATSVSSITSHFCLPSSISFNHKTFIYFCFVWVSIFLFFYFFGSKNERQTALLCVCVYEVQGLWVGAPMFRCIVSAVESSGRKGFGISCEMLSTHAQHTVRLMPPHDSPRQASYPITQVETITPATEMARTYLAVPASSAPSESDVYQDILESLICLKNWVNHNIIEINNVKTTAMSDHVTTFTTDCFSFLQSTLAFKPHLGSSDFCWRCSSRRLSKIRAAQDRSRTSRREDKVYWVQESRSMTCNGSKNNTGDTYLPQTLTHTTCSNLIDKYKIMRTQQKPLDRRSGDIGDKISVHGHRLYILFCKEKNRGVNEKYQEVCVREREGRHRGRVCDLTCVCVLI